ncbi:MAG: hypothetical protein OEO23_00290 [Gemmatimonadota bacterium]|nr:hypothetical protein [Gemmatimonadota bacterium]
MGGAQRSAVLYGSWDDPRSPTWIVLHGITVAGEDHPALVRFAGALAGSGAAVIIPRVQPWRQLDLDPGPGHRAVAEAVNHVRERRPRAECGLVGFSFGCPQVILAAASPEHGGAISGVVGFGGYGSLESTILFGLTGEYRDETTTRRIRPDPYGRWVVAGNYLHRVPGLEGAADVSQALRSLAVLAGARRIMSWDPVYDSVKDDLERRLDPSRRALFRLFAPPADREPDPQSSREMVPLLADAARRTHPLLEGRDTMEGPLPPVHLFHGRHDRLIPWVETLALARRLEGRTRVRTTVTGLFAHSQEESSDRSRLGEFLRFSGALRHVLAIPRPGRS